MSDPHALRRLLGHFATGVAVVTAVTPKGERAGVTINSFSSVSLDPELVLFSLDRSLFSLSVFEAAERFGINFLAADQQNVSRRFSAKGADKWADTILVDGHDGAPLIDGAIAHIACERHQVVEAGDHLLFLCRITNHAVGEVKEPLLYFKGRYCLLDAAPLAPAQMSA